MNKFRKCLAMLVCMALALTAVPCVTVWAEETSDGFIYEVYNDHVEITGYTGDASELEIPAEIEGLPVTVIDDDAFDNCDSLTSVTIPNGVTTIGEDAFNGCKSLTRVIIPDSVTTINMAAFYNCLSLTSVTIPDSVTSIGGSAFYNTGIYNDDSNWVDEVLYINNHLIVARESITGDYAIRQGTLTIAGAAFYNCLSLTSVTIPSSVATIGAWAFYHCLSLMSLTIPDSVTTIEGDAFDFTGIYNDDSNWVDDVLYIGNRLITARDSITGDYAIKRGTITIADGAFCRCESLTSVTIPNSITTIGECAFEHCRSLTSVTIPDSVTTISECAFAGCRSLTSVAIPASVKTINGSAFWDCRSLTSVTIPNSVTTIGDYAFDSCYTLTEVTIGDSVTVIGYRAFYDCDSLTSVAIPASVTTINGYAFWGCYDLTDVYYAGSEEDWMNIKIGSGNDYLLNATIHYNSVMPGGGSGGTVGNTNSTSANAPIILSAELIMNGKMYDVKSQTVNINKDSGNRCNLKVEVNWNGVPITNRQVYLTQGVSNQNDLPFLPPSKYDPLTNSFVNIELGAMFEADEPIYIMAVDRTDPKNKSTALCTKINIIDTDGDEVYQRSLLDGSNFRFGKDIELNIPDDIPIFGGTQLTWKIDFIPITIECEDGKMNIVLGLDVNGDGEFTFEEYKESFNDYIGNLAKKNSKQNRTLKQLRNDLRMSEANKRKNKGMTMSMWGNKVFKNSSKGEADTGIDIMGYAIAEKGKNGWGLKEGYICFEATVSYTYRGQVFIYVIPCYYSFEGSLNGKASAQIKDLDFNTFSPKFQTVLEAGVSAGVTGGIGVPQVAGLEASGNGSLNVKMDINNFEKDIEEYLKVYVDAGASFGLTIFGQKVASKEFWHLDGDNGIIYSTYPEDYGKSWIKPKNANPASLNSVYEGYSANNVYEVESRDYLNNGQIWNKGEQNIELMAADYSNKSLKTLASNIYPNAKPQICNIDGKKVLIFTADNAERSANNKQMLVYSVYDEDSGTWAEPQAVCDDGTADFYPQIAGEYIVWQNQESVMADDISLAEIGKQGEINIAKWNGSGFGAPTILTDNDELDTLPKIAVKDDEISVVWIKNSANDILGVDGESSLVKKVYNGSTWSEERQVKTKLNGVTDLSVGYDNETLYIAYIPDGDGDISTIDDREIYLIGSNETQVTDNETLDSNIVINNGKLYWYNESNICVTGLSSTDITTVFDEGRHKLAEGFTVSENNGNVAIMWSAASDDEESDAAEIKSVLYQDGEWGDIIEVSSIGGRAKYPTCVLDENGRILSAFTAEFENGTNLYTIDLTPSYDLSLEDVYFNENLLSPNSQNEFELTFKNKGELPIKDFTVNVYNENGTVNHSETFSELIKAGETKTITAHFETGESISLETLSVEAIINDGEEYVSDNNSIELEIGHSDVSIEEILNYEKLPTSTAAIVLKNTGYCDAENIVVEFRQGGIDGKIIETRDIGVLEPNEEKEVLFEYNPKDYDSTKWTINVTTDSEEISKGDNFDYFVNECAVNLEDVEHTILNCSVEGEVLTVNSYAKNNTESPIVGTVYVAVYNEKNMLKGVSSQIINIDSYSDTAADVWIDGYTYERGDYIKVFVWSKNIIPLSIADTVSLENVEIIKPEEYTSIAQETTAASREPESNANNIADNDENTVLACNGEENVTADLESSDYTAIRKK